MRKSDKLLFRSGQQRVACFGFDGCRVRNPHLDALARDGRKSCLPELRAQGREEPLTVWTAGPGLGGIDE